MANQTSIALAFWEQFQIDFAEQVNCFEGKLIL